MFSSLAVRNFRIWWIGMFVSLIGTWMQQVAQGWLIFELTRSAFLLGFAGFLSSLPILLLSLAGGVLADRVNKRQILLATQACFMLLAFLLAFMAYARVITPGQIMLIAFLNGTVMAFDAPARQALVVELSGREHLLNAIALNSVAFNLSRAIGPAIAGVLVSLAGASGCFFLNGISFLAVIFALLCIRLAVASPRKYSHPLDDLKEGLAFIAHNRLILLLVSIVGVVSLFGASYVILMPVFAADVLKSGAKGFGVLMSATGVGALAGALFLARLGDCRRKGRVMVYAAFIFSAGLIAFALCRVFVFSVCALALVGGSSVVAVALVNTILQTRVADAYRGRVMSVFMLTFAGMLPFGHLIAGSLAQAFGVSAAVLLGGIICFAFFLAINLAYPQLRRA